MQTRLLAVDFGERRVGIAISDPEGRLALPMRTLQRTTDRRLAAELTGLAAEHDVGGFVLGDPVLPGGDSSGASQRVRRFARRLAHRSGRPVAMVGEALTSREAAHRLAELENADPKIGDVLAAQIILEEALARARRSVE